MIRLAVALAAWLLPAAPGHAGDAPAFSLPVACGFGPAADCYVQNYVDLDPGPGFADPTCGPLGYDGDRGTDLAVRTLVELRAGVPVLAAADGTVRAIRDGEPDHAGLDHDPAAARDRAAGNAVVLDHGGGWETQYSHLRRGSVAVRPGERVRRGQRIGLMGLSGNTQFPHLEFAVRREGVPVDPFTGRPAGGGCGPGGESLWAEEAEASLAYRAGGLLALGLAGERPDLLAALSGAYAAAPEPQAGALVGWAVAWGLRAGDRETLILRAPDGRILAERRAEIPGNKARWFGFAGTRMPGGIPPGAYALTYRVDRKGRAVIEAERTVAID